MDQDLLAIISGVKSGRDEEFEKLKQRYKPLTLEMAKRFAHSGVGSLVDLSEEAERALLKAALSFDLSKEKITFGLYAKICVRNALISVGRANAADRRRKERAARTEKNQRKMPIISFGDVAPEEILEMLESSLSSFEKQVLREFFSGRSATETAETLDTDVKSVYNAAYRIRTKAKKLFAQIEKNNTV